MDENVRTATMEQSRSYSKRKVTPEFDSGVPVAPPVPVSPTLKSLKVGETAVFPIEQYSTVRATIFRIRRDFKRQGWDVEEIGPEITKDEFSIHIKRIR